MYLPPFPYSFHNPSKEVSEEDDKKISETKKKKVVTEGNLKTLPEEIFLNIFSCLQYSDLTLFSASNKSLRDLALKNTYLKFYFTIIKKLKEIPQSRHECSDSNINVEQTVYAIEFCKKSFAFTITPKKIDRIFSNQGVLLKELWPKESAHLITRAVQTNILQQERTSYPSTYSRYITRNETYYTPYLVTTPQEIKIKQCTSNITNKQKQVLKELNHKKLSSSPNKNFQKLSNSSFFEMLFSCFEIS